MISMHIKDAISVLRHTGIYVPMVYVYASATVAIACGVGMHILITRLSLSTYAHLLAFHLT